MKKILLPIILVLVIIFVVIYYSKSKVTVINNGSNTLTNIRLIIGDDIHSIELLPPGKSQYIKFSPHTDSSINISFTESNKNHEETFGYVTKGLKTNCIVEINEYNKIQTNGC